jgi:hypothetical protein
MAASEVLLLTSLSEDSGLPFLEAAAAGRPLIARALENVVIDLTNLGFDFPQLYNEIMVDPRLFDWPAECHRQWSLLRAWIAALPGICHKSLAVPPLLAQRTPRPLPFNRLTLTAQLEVLAQPPDFSWRLCAPLNPHVESWWHAAGRNELASATWPCEVRSVLGGAAYADGFARFIKTGDDKSPGSPLGVLTDFLREKLSPANLYPLLWSEHA